MNRKKIHNLLLLVLLSALFIVLGIEKIEALGKLSRLNEKTITSDVFRQQQLDEKMVSYLSLSETRGRDVGIYLLETKFGYERFVCNYTNLSFAGLKTNWKKQYAWNEYFAMNRAIWDDVEYFPIPISTIDKKAGITYENSWMTERTYGGNRGHEGVDLMTKQNVADRYPVVSMTDGVVTKKGWLEKGGYRIGITSPSGGYFYYAHLSSYGNVKEGDEVRAGDILGFVGNTGYGPEGTTGKFPVHLHLGIYIYPNGKEMSVNPYWVLRFLESYKLKYAYSTQ